MYEYGHHDGGGFYVQPDVAGFWAGHGTDSEQQVAQSGQPLLGQPLPAQPLIGQPLLGQPLPGQSPLGQHEVNCAWDPAEELAYLLQDSRAPRQADPFDWTGFEDNGSTVNAEVPVAGLPQNAYQGHGPHPETPHGHRRVPPKAAMLTLFRTGSLFSALLVAVIAAVVSLFSGLAISDALRHSAGPHTTHDVVSWWPLLIYGPWMVASLSILRAALHQRRAIHSWSIVLLFSTLATLLCVAQATRTFPAQAAATLPPVAALACFQQLVRQITLTRPPRHPVPRHRNRTTFPLRPTPAPSSPGTPLPDYPMGDHKAGGDSAPGYRVRYGA
ncbi:MULTISPECIES: hypothetical protein [unclassified Streptomyces]|uniref:hypothetical protein n=1 Tax=unclassified Streptomyces TaxID=2593676 RepID=UPI002E0EABE9|nr:MULTISPECIES: hypothetical protein [unclassified Streptomyces]WSR23174.1 hypothetical protein OG573_31265 [Streptomyces sp. NBC_01205]